MQNEPRHVQKSKAETYGRDESRFTDLAPEPPIEVDADDHRAAAYAAGCETAMNNGNVDALSRGDTRKQKNIKQVAEDM